MKAHANSLWAELTEEQRDELFMQLTAGMSYEDAAMMVQGWGLDCSTMRVWRCLERHGLEWRVQQARKAAEETATPDDVDAETRRGLKLQAYRLSFAALSAKEVAALTKLGQDDERLKFEQRKHEAEIAGFKQTMAHKERELQLATDKFEDQRLKVAAKVEKLREAGSALSDTERSALLDQVDEILGIRKK